MTSSTMDITNPANQRFAFVIPAYNHQEMIGRIIDQAKTYKYPVFVINDGSTDQTSTILKGIPGITILEHPENLGKGAALLTGFQAASKIADWAITLDADGQHDPQDTENLMSALNFNKRLIVVGVRKGMDEKHVPWTSRLGRSLSNFWVFVSGGAWLKDTQSGFRIYPIPETVNLKIKSRRYQFEVEVLVKAKWAGLPVIEVPISVHYAPGSKRISHFKPFLDIVRIVAVFAKLISQRLLIPSFVRRRMTSSSGRNRKT